MELLRRKCPACHSSNIQYHSSYTTKNYGGRVMYKCENCPASFSETKNTLLEGLKTPVSVIWQVIKARTNGLGLNAATRTFDKAKNTKSASGCIERSEEHTSELQSRSDLVCRLLLEKK